MLSDAASDRLEDVEYFKAIELYKTNIVKKCFRSFKLFAVKNGENKVQNMQAESFLKLKNKQKVFLSLQNLKSRN